MTINTAWPKFDSYVLLPESQLVRILDQAQPAKALQGIYEPTMRDGYSLGTDVNHLTNWRFPRSACRPCTCLYLHLSMNQHGMC
jgi:hypothetical protein